MRPNLCFAVACPFLGFLAVKDFEEKHIFIKSSYQWNHLHTQGQSVIQLCTLKDQLMWWFFCLFIPLTSSAGCWKLDKVADKTHNEGLFWPAVFPAVSFFRWPTLFCDWLKWMRVALASLSSVFWCWGGQRKIWLLQLAFVQLITNTWSLKKETSLLKNVLEKLVNHT